MHKYSRSEGILACLAGAVVVGVLYGFIMVGHIAQEKAHIDNHGLPITITQVVNH